MYKKEKTKKEIGKRIEIIRNNMNITKESFADLIDVTGQHLGKVISGEKGLSIDKIIEISDKTGYSTDFILKGTTTESEIINSKVNKIKKNIEKIDEILKTI